jgi:hypothetical protein
MHWRLGRTRPRLLAGGNHNYADEHHAMNARFIDAKYSGFGSLAHPQSGGEPTTSGSDPISETLDCPIGHANAAPQDAVTTGTSKRKHEIIAHIVNAFSYKIADIQSL